MSCPSALYTVNTNYSVVEGADVPFGNIVRRYGRNCQLNGGGISLIGGGYYDIESTFTFTPTGAGDVTVQFYQDGLGIPGAVATFAGTAGSAVTVPIICLVRNCGGSCNTTITASVSAAGVVNNFATKIEKA